jgi:hypothetical protein
LLELTFDYKKIGINQLTNNLAQNGDLYMNYDTFNYNYMSLDTYVKNADYIGANFTLQMIFIKKNSQDFSNSVLVI